jgi:hypothetical protein
MKCILIKELVKEETKQRVGQQLAAAKDQYPMTYNSLFLLQCLLIHKQHIIPDNENDLQLPYNTTDLSKLDPHTLHMLVFLHHLHTIPLQEKIKVRT